jgi:rhodanese-related sulfurtransferase
MKHLNLIALGGIVIILAVLFGIATIRITGKYRFEKSAQEMLGKVTTESKQLSLKEAETHVGTEDVVFIDIRTPKEFVGFHIKGAVNIPYDRLLDDEYAEFFNNDQKKIIYGTSSVAANAVWLILTQYGYENLFALDGSVTDWIAHIETKDVFSDGHKGDEVALFDYAKVMEGKEE